MSGLPTTFLHVDLVDGLQANESAKSVRQGISLTSETVNDIGALYNHKSVQHSTRYQWTCRLDKRCSKKHQLDSEDKK